jgi:hypothetical protein
MSDSWHSRIGSTAIAVLTAFFESEANAHLFKSNESRQEFAKKALKDGAFLYSDTKSSNPEVSIISKT